MTDNFVLFTCQISFIGVESVRTAQLTSFVTDKHRENTASTFFFLDLSVQAHGILRVSRRHHTAANKHKSAFDVVCINQRNSRDLLVHIWTRVGTCVPPLRESFKIKKAGRHFLLACACILYEKSS